MDEGEVVLVGKSRECGGGGGVGGPGGGAVGFGAVDVVVCGAVDHGPKLGPVQLGWRGDIEVVAADKQRFLVRPDGTQCTA